MVRGGGGWRSFAALEMVDVDAECTLSKMWNGSNTMTRLRLVSAASHAPDESNNASHQSTTQTFMNHLLVSQSLRKGGK